jgi:demethylspheroidene O-methyltransferase
MTRRGANPLAEALGPQPAQELPHVSSVAERWLSIRNRLLANPRFQKFAASTPGIRTIARGKASTVFDLLSGFIYSQVLLACVRLDLFRLLEKEPLTFEAIAAHADLPLDPARRLLDAAVSLDLMCRLKDGRYGLGMNGAAILANPGIAAMIEHNAILYQDLADPVDFLRHPDRETALSRYWAYAQSEDPSKLPDEAVGGYSALMSASQPLVASEILDAYPFQNHKCLMDVGGGEGRFLCSAGAHYPHLALMMFDLPAVAARAEKNITASGLTHRAQVFGGSFFTDELPKGADIVTLVRILHDHDDDKAAQLLANIHRALPPGGHLLIAEPLAETRGAQRMGDAYFGFYLMAMRSGRPRSLETIEKMLHRGGFGGVRAVPTRVPLQTSLIVAQR